MSAVVEVAPILKAVAKRHGISCKTLRQGPAMTDARKDAAETMREAGLTLRAIAFVLNCDHRGIHRHLGPGPAVGRADAASWCSECEQLLPVTKFSRSARAADGCQVYCKACHLALARKSRKVRYRRRRGVSLQSGKSLKCWVSADLHAALRDTAERHRLTSTEIVERALRKALACRDCGCRTGRLREVGSDCCAACDAPWVQAVSA